MLSIEKMVANQVHGNVTLEVRSAGFHGESVGKDFGEVEA
jgi:hypothetical protein